MTKSAAALAGFLTGSVFVIAQTATFTFTDPSIEEGDIASFFIGDAIGGDVVIDLSDGNYTVTWNASPLLEFVGPERFDLALGNLDTGEVVTLSYEIPVLEFNSQVVYSGTETTMANWAVGDELVTTGGPPDFGTEFASGVYSTDPFVPIGFNVDFLDTSGFLEGDEPEIVDTDGDGIPDDTDPFPSSDLTETVTLLGMDTGIANNIADLPVTESGATLADVIQELESDAAANSKNGGDYVQRLVKDFKVLAKDGWITDKQRAQLIKIIAKGKK